MRAILVAVDYADLLAITLPYNRQHFDEVMVVTSLDKLDDETRDVAAANDCRVCSTDLFFGGGNAFNKFAALERGLDKFGRHGMLCVMDADILFPKHLPDVAWDSSVLYTPKRRMFVDITQPIPQEPYWAGYPYPLPNEEFAGYTQIFDADAASQWLPKLWYGMTNPTAGGPDSAFQARWPDNKKLRPGFEVLHLGPACTNWCGRVSKYTDGSVHPEAAARTKALVRSRPDIEKWKTVFNQPEAG
jgi:hypothetical protein